VLEESNKYVIEFDMRQCMCFLYTAIIICIILIVFSICFIMLCLNNY